MSEIVALVPQWSKRVSLGDIKPECISIRLVRCSRRVLIPRYVFFHPRSCVELFILVISIMGPYIGHTTQCHTSVDKVQGIKSKSRGYGRAPRLRRSPDGLQIDCKLCAIATNRDQYGSIGSVNRL